MEVDINFKGNIQDARKHKGEEKLPNFNHSESLFKWLIKPTCAREQKVDTTIAKRTATSPAPICEQSSEQRARCLHVT